MHDSVVCVANADGRVIGITDDRCVAHALTLGLADESLARCMWQLPTRQRFVYTPTHVFMRMRGGYAWTRVDNQPQRTIPWDDVCRTMPSMLADVVMQLGDVAVTHMARLYVVGGTVRNVLQAEPITDLDVAMYGEMAVIGPAIAQQLATPIMQHSAFDTLSIGLPQSVIDQTGITHLDIVPLRTETYTQPGALPNVHPTASIVTDLGRRDLTINAMALAYVSHVSMPLYDPFRGYDDLMHKRARLLHPLSIIDDPTRVVRLARLVVRLQLRMDTMTRRAVRWGVTRGVIDCVSMPRWMNEIDRTLGESQAGDVWALLHKWGVLRQIDCALGYGVDPALHRLHAEWRIVAVIWRAPLSQLTRLMERWHQSPKALRGIVLLKRTKRMWQRLAHAAPSRAATYLRQFDRRLIQSVAELEPLLATVLVRVTQATAHMPLMRVRGGDLIGLGVTPGPIVGQLLSILNDALLDGVIDATTADAQLAWLRGHRRWRSTNMTTRRLSPKKV